MEIWKDVKGYEGIYQVSSLGNVKSLERVKVFSNGRIQKYKEKILKLSINTSGYYIKTLNKNNIKKSHRVHQLVAVAFLNHIPNGYEKVIDHIDNNKLNNKIENLQLVTNRENCSKDRKNIYSKHTGVSWDKSRLKWISQIKIKGKSKFLGRFTNELDAAKAYQKALKSVEI